MRTITVLILVTTACAQPAVHSAAATSTSSEPPAPTVTAKAPPPRSADEQRLYAAIRQTSTATGPGTKWSQREETIAALAKVRRETTGTDAFLVDIVAHDTDAAVRLVVARLISDMDRTAPLFHDQALATRLVAAAENEANVDTKKLLSQALGLIDLESTSLDARIRDFAQAHVETLGDGLISRVLIAARTSPRAALMVAEWLAEPPSTARQLTQINVSTQTNDPNPNHGAALCGLLLEACKDPALHRGLDAIATGEGCTEEQRATAKRLAGIR